MDDGTERLSLLDSLNRDGRWIKLPFLAMQEVGPAAQTLGGLLAITKRETFTSVASIAEHARLPVGTVRKHLITLDYCGWIRHKGRGLTRAGYLRRTATIAIRKRAINAARDSYGVLPWWACCSIRRFRRLPWSTRAVLSVIMARLMTLKAAAEEQDGHGLEADDIIGSIDNMGGDDRFRFGLKSLAGQTGLSRDSIISAKRWLDRAGIVRWRGQDPSPGVTTPTDLLVPNWGFLVVVTPASPGRCFIDFHGGSKSGQ